MIINDVGTLLPTYASVNPVTRLPDPTAPAGGLLHTGVRSSRVPKGTIPHLYTVGGGRPWPHVQAQHPSLSLKRVVLGVYFIQNNQTAWWCSIWWFPLWCCWCCGASENNKWKRTSEKEFATTDSFHHHQTSTECIWVSFGLLQPMYFCLQKKN